MNTSLLLKSTLLLIACSVVFAAEPSIEKIRLIWHEDPAHHAVVAWCGDQGSVLYGEKGSELDQTALLTRSNQAIDLRNNFVHLKDLKANTAYSLTIKTRAAESRQFWFQTAPDQPSSFAFIAGGDSRNHHDARIRANKMVAKLRPLFVAFGGDMTSRDTNAEWRKWLDDWQHTITADGKLTPIIAARGNHERKNESISNVFNTPEPNIYYASQIGGDKFLRLYTLNTEIEVGGLQKEWLADDLKQHPHVLWKLAQYHKPMRPHVKSKREGIKQYRAWAALFYQYGFNIVVECDSHCVKRTWPIRPSLSDKAFEGFIRDDERGTVFIGEGCWGAPLRAADDKKPWTKAAASFNQIKWVHVHPDRIESRSVAVDNVDQVESIDDAQPFTEPKGIQIWAPETGAVEVIKARPNFKANTEELSSLKLLDTEILFDIDKQFFDEQCTVSITCTSPVNGKLHYTLDGSHPTQQSPIYSAALSLSESTVISACFITESNERSLTLSTVVRKIPAAFGEQAPKPDVALADLEWTEQKAGWSETQKNKNIAGRPLRIAGVTYEQGIGMHSYGYVVLTCDPSWKRFVATAGLDDQVRGQRLAAIEVEADGVNIYRSEKPFAKLDRHHINVPIPEGCKQIKIIAAEGGDGPAWDNVNLVNAGFCKE